MRLTSSSELLGMPASRHWALLADNADETLLRTDLIFDPGHQISWQYVPRSQCAQL
ncbi:hypothetical protein [Gemmatimonas phototrophica]|uniref:hypothetical protein n=1 Tax=Gemmatimonas phototrophica TaxID=1379270 RepID=UPI000AF422F4|nr:hypothetical protein [Gemmatimonas phototrophica]